MAEHEDYVDYEDERNDEDEEWRRQSPEIDGVVIPDQDRFLPICNISRIMRRMIPDNGKMAKDAKELIQEAVSEFISFVTSEASDRCLAEKRKTITAEDLLDAMVELDFEAYHGPLKAFLERYREATRVSYKRNDQDGGAGTMNAAAVGMPSSSTSRPTAGETPVQSSVLPPAAAASAAPNTVSSFLSDSQPVHIADGPLSETLEAAVENLQSVQIFVDPESGQHYIYVNSDGETRLMPVDIAPSRTADTHAEHAVVGADINSGEMHVPSNEISTSHMENGMESMNGSAEKRRRI